MNWAKGTKSANVEDRRAVPVVGAPTSPNALLHGMPQTAYEWEQWRKLLDQRGVLEPTDRQPMPTPTVNPDDAARLKPTPEDPTGIEAKRRHEATKRAEAAREAFLKLSQRL